MSPAMALFGRKPEAAPLTKADLALLRDWSRPYSRMRGALKTEFEDQMAHFLAEHRITGVGLEPPLEREDLLLVAASACTLSCGWPGHRWTTVSEILLYADDFDRDYRVGGEEESTPEFSGQAHPWGTVLMSLPSLRDDFEDPHDGQHVGYHEFAHVLARGRASIAGFESDGGIPSNINRRFATVMSKALQEARSALAAGDSPLDEYGLQSPAELWAVSVEAFFETSGPMKAVHPDLWELLDLYFNQRPSN
jgi:Mlc titration factor MtfA (ptsG expression regulator)